MTETTPTPLFSFAIVSDTHIRPNVLDQSSPWQVNGYANGRARHMVDMLLALEPEFVIHMGDVVHPLPSLPSYEDAISEAKDIFSPITVPMHVIPGNHDIGDKPMPGLPAAPIDSESIMKFRENFGSDHWCFEYGGCRFVLLNVELLNSGLPQEAEQRAWAEDVLSSPFSGRTFVFTHYPPFILKRDEPSNYDNLDEPARSWLVDLIARSNATAVFSGHVHNYFHNHVEGTDYYTFPSLSFVRQDYSELFRGEPGTEYGRDDADKLGFFVVDVFEDSISLRPVRTYGRMRESERAAAPTHVAPRPRGAKPSSALGVHLRHDWAEVQKLPYNGPMDEFLRKEVRNDYQMLGLLEMDLGHVRLPLRDFADPDYTARLQDFRRFGIKVTAFHFGLPGEAEINRVAENCDVIETFEVIVSWKDRHDFLAQAAGWRSRLSCELALTRVESSAEKKTAGVFAHYVSYGFNEDAWLEVASFLAEPGAASVVDRFVFTLGAKAALAQTVARLDAAAVEAGTRLSYNVRMASENPAAFAGSEDWAAARVAEAVLLAESDRSRVLMCDTMVTTERGYFPRQGLLDRRMNPTTAGKVCRTLGALLSGRKVSLDEMSDDASGRRFEFTVDGESLALVLPTEAAVAMAGGAKLPEGHCIFELTEGTAMRTTPEGVPMLACSKAFARKAGLDHHGQTFLAATKEILPTC